MITPIIDGAEEIVRAYSLTALGVVGSRARGDYGRHSDLDLVGVAAEESSQTFDHLGTFTELHIVSDVGSYGGKPAWWYTLRDMVIVSDDGSLATLKRRVQPWFSSYRSPQVERERNRHWLLATRRKLLNSTSELQITYELSTSFWQLLIGSFLVKDLPVPANSDMFRLAPEVLGENRLEQLLLAHYNQRKLNALALIKEIVEAD